MPMAQNTQSLFVILPLLFPMFQHADFEQTCETNGHDRAAEEKMCDHLITAARRRDGVLASRLVDKVVDVLTTTHSVGSPDNNASGAITPAKQVKC